MTDVPPPRRRGWIDALVATALRWNDRLSRPIGGSPSPRRAARAAARPIARAGPRAAVANAREQE